MAQSSGGDGDDSNGPLPASTLRVAQPRAVDVCSLFDPDVLAKFGTREQNTSRFSFNSCHRTVSECKDPAKFRSRIETQRGYLETADEPAEVERVKKRIRELKRKLEKAVNCGKNAKHEVNGYVEIELELQDTSYLSELPKIDAGYGVDAVSLSKLQERSISSHTVLKFPKTGSQCAYAIPLDQPALIIVRATPSGEDGNENDLCMISSTITKSVIEKLAAGTVEQFSRPSNSLAFVNICDKINQENVREAGFNWTMSRVTDFGRQCEWIRKSRAALVVRTTIGIVPHGDDAPEPSKFAGRKTWVGPKKKDSGAVSCAVRTPHLSLQPDNAVPTAELAIVRFAAKSSTGTDPCAVAKAIAKVVWPKLPQP